MPEIVALGTSTGGPKALQEILPQLPADLPVGMIVVQHMPPGFTAPFARRLASLSKVKVREAAARGHRRGGRGVYRARRSAHDRVAQNRIESSNLSLR